MKTQLATAQDQSARLLECGVSAESADMSWIVPNRLVTGGVGFPTLMCAEYFNHDDSLRQTPAWSLSALLGLLPASILSPMGDKYMLELSKLRMHDAWEVQWFNGSSRVSTRDKQWNFHCLWDKSPIEACVKAIEWLSANGYKLNEQ